MRKYVEFDIAGKILKYGVCPTATFNARKHNGDRILQVQDLQSGLDLVKKVVAGKVVDKTPAEIEADKLPEKKPIPFEQKQANLTNEQLQEIIDRITELERRV